MIHFLQAFSDLVIDLWVPLLIVIFFVLTILTWTLPSWRGNALSSIGGFLASFGGLWWGCWIAANQPPWSRAILAQLQLEGIHTSWLDLRPHMGRMICAGLGGGLAYVVGLILTKWGLRAWHRWRGDTYQDSTTRTTLSPFH